MTQPARRKNIPEVNLSDVYGLQIKSLPDKQVYVPVFDTEAGAGQELFLVPFGGFAGVEGSSVPNTIAQSVGSNNIRATLAHAVGDSNYIGGKMYAAAANAGSTTINATGNIAAQLSDGDFIYITSTVTNETVLRQIVTTPAYTITTDFEIDQAVDLASESFIFSVAGQGDFSRTVGAFNSISGKKCDAIGTSNEITKNAENSSAIGFNNYVDHISTVVRGRQGKSPFHGASVVSAKALDKQGDCQIIDAVVGGITTNGTITELFLFNGTSRLVLPSNTLWRFRAEAIGFVVAGSGTIGDSKSQDITGTMKNVAGTVSQVAAFTAAAAINDVGFVGTFTLSADNVNKCLKIQVTGEVGRTIKWVVRVSIVQTLI